MGKIKIIRITTIPGSMRRLLLGQLKFMSEFFEIIGITSPGPEVEDIIHNEGIRVKCVKMTRRITPISDIIALIRIIIFIIKEKPYIVHTHTPKAGTLGMIASWICRVPVRLHTVAGLPLMESKGIKKRILMIVEQITYKCATKVYSNSYLLMDYIINSRLCKVNKISVLGNGSSNGINTHFFSKENVDLKKINLVKHKYNITSDDFVFIYIGRIVKDKGINELIEAFNNISIINKNVRLLLVGKQEHELSPLDQKTICIMNTNSQIHVVGYQMDVRPYLLSSDALVFPTYREGFPNVPMQACSMGLPAIVTNINGCNEIINETNGILIQPKNIAALYSAMLEFVNNPELVKRLSLNARNSIVSRFDQNIFWQVLKNEYDLYINRNLV